MLARRLGSQALTRGEGKQTASASLRVPTPIHTGTHGSGKTHNGRGRKKKKKKSEEKRSESRERERVAALHHQQNTHTYTHNADGTPCCVQTPSQSRDENQPPQLKSLDYDTMSRGFSQQLLLAAATVWSRRCDGPLLVRSFAVLMLILLWSFSCASGAAWLVPVAGRRWWARRHWGSSHRRSHLLDMSLQWKTQWPDTQMCCISTHTWGGFAHVWQMFSDSPLVLFC